METAKFCEMLNIRSTTSTTEHTRKRNECVAPYSSPNDWRLDWLQNVFLSYLDDWYRRIAQRPSVFTKDDRGKMLMSQQTYEGMKTTVNSLIEVVKFLLSEGCEFVLSERFRQDPLKEYFRPSSQYCKVSKKHDFPSRYALHDLEYMWASSVNAFQFGTNYSIQDLINLLLFSLKLRETKIRN